MKNNLKLVIFQEFNGSMEKLPLLILSSNRIVAQRHDNSRNQLTDKTNVYPQVNIK